MADHLSSAAFLQKLGIDPELGTRSMALSGAADDPNKPPPGGIVVGQAPNGFGQVVFWDRKDAEVMLVCYINSADSLGVAVANVATGDRVIVEMASGMASFTASDGSTAKGIIGVVATAASAGAAALGAPQAAPLIKAAGDFAAAEFGKPSTGKVRDAFGKEKGVLRRCEGGILVCMPEAGGPFYRADCIKGEDKGERTDDRLPDHMVNRGAFFPIQGNEPHNTRHAQGDGFLHVIAWDSKFEDNAGFYMVAIRLTRADALPPPPPLL